MQHGLRCWRSSSCHCRARGRKSQTADTGYCRLLSAGVFESWIAFPYSPSGGGKSPPSQYTGVYSSGCVTVVAAGIILKFKTLDSLEAVFFFNSFNTGKWWSGTSIYYFDGCLQTSHFLAKMEGDFYTPISHYSQPLYESL